MSQLNKNRLGLTLGIVFALIHLIWAVIVAFGFGDLIFSWLVGKHFIEITYRTIGFSFGIAIFLVLRAFVGGYLIGWVSAWIYNKLR